MEDTDSLLKQQAVDSQGAFAGNLEPDPEESDIDILADEAGISTLSEGTLRTKEKLDQRDQNRWELDPDSAQE